MLTANKLLSPRVKRKPMSSLDEEHSKPIVAEIKSVPSKLASPKTSLSPPSFRCRREPLSQQWHDDPHFNRLDCCDLNTSKYKLQSTVDELSKRVLGGIESMTPSIKTVSSQLIKNSVDASKENSIYAFATLPDVGLE